ncbi:hypothetical protein C0995_002263 [Termitomyces sp. Mi166|nr:hypothetical protein C0995_002263 [Termitomyces sp. Mi166\
MPNIQLSDVIWIRWLVYYLFAVETANTAFDMFTMYEPLILRYEPIVIAGYMVSYAAPPLTSETAGGCWTGTMVAILKLFEKKPQLHDPALLWFLSACVADILITASLVYSLSKRRTGNFLWDLALSKLYTNCLLSTLNARASLNDKATGSSHAARMSSGNARRQIGTFDSPNDDLVSPTYELNTPKSYGPTSSYSQDVEYGITVTKVVERIEDAQPVHPYSTQ